MCNPDTGIRATGGGGGGGGHVGRTVSRRRYICHHVENLTIIDSLNQRIQTKLLAVNSLPRRGGGGTHVKARGLAVFGSVAI